MKGTALLTLLSIGIVAGDGAWKLNYEYKYKLEAKTFITLPESNKWVGVISRARFSIQPQSEDLLIGDITQAEYAEIDQQLSEVFDLNFHDKELAYQQWPLNKPFKIHLKNGAIRSLSVDPTMNNDQINQLKVIATQFQVDTNAQNEIESKDNQLPEEDGNNGFFKTMESTVTGTCETIYDISVLPEYLAETHRDWIPLPELKGKGEFIEIVKTKNDKNCNERIDYHFSITGHHDFQSNTNQSLTEISRIVVSGSLKSYTIQSSVTKRRVIGNPGLFDNVNVMLDSVQENYRQIWYGNMLDIGNLAYTYNLPHESQSSERTMNSRYALPQGNCPSRRSNVVYGCPIILSGDDHEDKWSSCWTRFPPSSTVCKSEFGPEYHDMESKNCGFLGLGRAIKCSFTFPGCQATPCFSAFIPRSELCKRTFGTDLPVTKGGFDDCSPGFYRSRCCPN